MREPIEVKKLNEHIYLLNDNCQASGYLVVGTNKAIVIDTMNGYEDVYAVVRKITDLPLIVINTHGHIDHISGNAYFNQKVYINKKDILLAKGTYIFSPYREIKADKNLPTVKFTKTKNGQVFDLGGVTIKVIDFAGHTKGGILLLDKEDKVLFTGDSINRHCWMQLAFRASFKTLQKSLDKIKPLRSEYDFILHGHAQNFEPASLYEEFVDAVKDLMQGNIQNDQDYTYFAGTCKQHKFPSGNGVIIYNK